MITQSQKALFEMASLVMLIVMLMVAAFAGGWVSAMSRASQVPYPRPTARAWELGYGRGVNEALDCAALLSLEQQLQGTNRPWGDMKDIVRTRLQVPKER